jgi:hypothetical protein
VCKSSICSLEANQSTGELNEGEMIFGGALPPDPQPAKVVVPAIGSFDDPAPRLLAADGAGEGGLSPTPDMWPDAASASLPFGLVVVIPFVQAEILRTSGPSRCTQWNRVERPAYHVHVVDVGPGERHRQRDALAVGQDVAFGAEFCAIGRVGAREVPPFGALTLALSSDAQSHSMPTLSS